MKRLFLAVGILAGLSFGPQAFAGAEGHGGMGIYGNNGKLYLVDFDEANIESQPKFDRSIPIRQDYLKRVTTVLSNIFTAGSPEISMVAQKLSEIANVSNITSESLLIGMENYTWNPIDKVTISPHDNHAIMPGAYVTLALRRQRSITFNPNFLKLDSNNRVGTIFHEISYAFVPPDNGSQNSDRAKEFNAMLFSQPLSQRANLLRTLANSLGIPFGMMTMVNTNIPTGLSIGRIAFNPSVMWFLSYRNWYPSDNQPADCNVDSDSNCFNGLSYVKYNINETQDPIPTFCASVGVGTYAERDVKLATNILELSFQSYTDVNGSRMDYVRAALIPDTTALQSDHPVDVSLNVNWVNCGSEFHALVASSSVTSFFSGFRSY